MTTEDRTHLRRAIELATLARTAGDQPYGSLLVADGVVLAEERNTVVSDRDITAHPELKLARWAARELDRGGARRTTMYTSCEPCAMCAEAIRRSGIGRVVFALSIQQLRDLHVRVAADSFAVSREGPALFDEARFPVDCYDGRPTETAAGGITAPRQALSPSEPNPE
jgi:tRNA(Arg) A34 adenosine deaminase TadA